MPIGIDTAVDDIVVIRATGKLTKEDYTAFVAEFERRVRTLGKLRVLFDITGFGGWEAGALWEEVKFDAKHNADYRRLAVVGDQKWQQVLVTLFKPLVFAETRYFPQSESEQARQWLLMP